MEDKPNKAQELRDRLKNYFEDLAKETDAARITEAMQKYIQAAAQFHHYSLNNQFLIFWQKPDAKRCAGYNTWLKLKRHVNKGEHGIAILAPCPKEITEKDAAGNEKKRKVIFFKTVYIFDVSQTDGEPLPEAPNWQGDGSIYPAIHQALIDYAASLQITVDVEDLEGETMGYSAGGKIVLSPKAGTRALIHELAHEILHQGINRDYTQERATKEHQAEAVSAVVCKHYGIETPEAPNYLALWNADSAILKANLSTVTETAKKIIDAIEKTPAQEAEPA